MHQATHERGEVLLSALWARRPCDDKEVALIGGWIASSYSSSSMSAKTMSPALVLMVEITLTFWLVPILSTAWFTTIIVPSARYPSAWWSSLPFLTSATVRRDPTSTVSLSANSMSLRLSTSAFCRRAILARLSSVVRIFALSSLPVMRIDFWLFHCYPLDLPSLVCTRSAKGSAIRLTIEST